MIHIACNIDSKYVKYNGVMLISLFENNKNESFLIHIIADDLSDHDRYILSEITAKYHQTIKFYTPNSTLLKGFTVQKFSKRISLATYYRCLLADILPTDIDRVLYLDSDIIICGNITPLWKTPLDTFGIAAVEDLGCNINKRYNLLQYPKEYSYFNAGVLLINLEYWRKHNLTKVFIEYYHKNHENLLFNDQDLLNCIFYKNKKKLDLCWNVQDGFYRNPPIITSAWKDKYAGILKKPIILHYTNRKPWNYDSQHPLRSKYFQYLLLSPWKNDVALNKTSSKIKRFFRLLPFYIGLRRPKYVNMDLL